MALCADRMSLALRTRLRCALVVCAVAGAWCWWNESPALAQSEVGQGRSREPAAGLVLPPRAAGHTAENPAGRSAAAGNSGLWTTVIALGGIVTVLLLAGRWIKPYVGAARGLPIEALELLGRRLIEPKVSVHLVRCGGRVLVLGVSPDGVRTLSEITDPVEVERLIDACLHERDARRTTDSGRSLSPRETSFNARASSTATPRSREPRVASLGRDEEVSRE